jgi:hypothetical protein
LRAAPASEYLKALDKAGLLGTLTDPKGILATLLFIGFGGAGLVGAFVTKKWADELWEHFTQ